MKHLVYILLFFLFSNEVKAQYSPITLEYNMIYFFSPSDIVLPSRSERFRTYSLLTIDINNRVIKTFYGINTQPIETIYRIDEVSEIQSSKDNGNYFIFTCTSPNYATVIFEVNIDLNWIRRYILHNKISHLFYNE